MQLRPSWSRNNCDFAHPHPCLWFAKYTLRPGPHVAPTIPPRTVDCGEPSTAQGGPCVPPRWHAVNLCCAVMTDVHGVVRILSCVTTACTYLVWKACKQGQNKVVCYGVTTYCWAFHRPNCHCQWSPGLLLEQARRCRRGPSTRRYYHRPNAALPPTCFCSMILRLARHQDGAEARISNLA